MDGYVAPEGRLPRHADFQQLFQAYVRPIAGRLIVTKARFAVYDGNESSPLATWDSAPIEILIADCGRTFDANEAWWGIFSKGFVSGRTLIVMQDWGTHRELPALWYNQMLQFVESKRDHLRLLHDLKDGGVGTFLFV
jgi:hypothetical protein